MSRQPNRLINELSPYLLQHAHNPVDWHPWGAEAFAKARAEDKPLLVSIGYATCHWCHVMERESFENTELAYLLNQTFVPVKVDREERPDLDSIFMTACHLVSGRGGWPLNVLLTPDGRPFFAFTYLPPKSAFGRGGLEDLVARLQELWQTKRQDVLASAESLTQGLRQACSEGAELGSQAGPDVGTTATQAGRDLAQRFDAQHGGFGAAPKFPTPHNLLLLLALHEAGALPEALTMTERTLQAMRLGGLWDQVGFGFHRYSTDAEWLLPHFEKMLYDQALLLLTYLEAWRVTGQSFYRRTAEELLTYLRRDLLAPEGGFFCAEDADSEGVEGKFYVFTLAEVEQALGEHAPLARDLLGCSPDGNFRDEAHGTATGQNILHFSEPLSAAARRLQLPEDELDRRWAEARQALYALRSGRVRPLLDDKILVDWNGLLLAALARGARLLPDSDCLELARGLADFVLGTLRTDPPEGLAPDARPLLRRYRKGQAGIPALQQDYAFFCWGLVELAETETALGNPQGAQYLQAALELCDLMLELFRDTQGGGLFMTSPRTGEQLLCRPKEFYDGALPSGNSVACLVLQRLGRLCARPDLLQCADELLAAAGESLRRQPSAHTFLLWGALQGQDTP